METKKWGIVLTILMLIIHNGIYSQNTDWAMKSPLGGDFINAVDLYTETESLIFHPKIMSDKNQNLYC